MNYHFKIHKEQDGYWAECIELTGCRTQAESMAELVKNASEALNLFLSEPSDSKKMFPLPKKKMPGSGIFSAKVTPQIAFAFHLRRLRLRHGLTQKETARRMGFKNLFSYQRLENAKTANPVLATIIQIKRVFPEFSLDDVLAI
ncbi:type II toxin-antitoxin system HicB family antitoxin [Bdellovibrionota bacterium FG-1]